MVQNQVIDSCLALMMLFMVASNNCFITRRVFLTNHMFVIIIQEALRTRGLKDDTTCIVVDIIPPGQTIRPPSPPKKMNKLKSLIFRKKAKEPSQKLTKQHSGADAVEEIFEEGSAMLSERLDRFSPNVFFRIFMCVFALAPCLQVSVAGFVFFQRGCSSILL